MVSVVCEQKWKPNPSGPGETKFITKDVSSTTLILDRANVLVKENFTRHLLKGLWNGMKFQYLGRNLTSIRKSTTFTEPFADPIYFKNLVISIGHFGGIITTIVISGSNIGAGIIKDFSNFGFPKYYPTNIRTHYCVHILIPNSTEMGRRHWYDLAA